MIRYMLGFTIGVLFTVTVLLWAARPPDPILNLPAPGWYNPAHILRYA
jgi:hypothetical protein